MKITAIIIIDLLTSLNTSCLWYDAQPILGVEVRKEGDSSSLPLSPKVFSHYGINLSQCYCTILLTLHSRFNQEQNKWKLNLCGLEQWETDVSIHFQYSSECNRLGKRQIIYSIFLHQHFLYCNVGSLLLFLRSDVNIKL